MKRVVLALIGIVPLAARGQSVELPPIDVVSATPLLGSGIDARKVPAQVNILNAQDLAATGPASLTRALSDQVGGVTLDNAAGNPYQPDLFYHGFRASALQGVEQGLAVYVGGVRFNQAFGDTVNWDLIPNNAIDQVNIEGSNPAFGLNAIGGALNVRLKNGFTYQGGEASLSGGSFGRIQGEFQYGAQSGDTAAYLAMSETHENGWRDFQSSDIQNAYGDVGWRNDRSELHVSLTAAQSRLNGPGTTPVELLSVDSAAQFTGPNAVANSWFQLAVTGQTQLTDTLSVQANLYYGYFRQRVTNGNAPAFAPCGGVLCDTDGAALTGSGGVPITNFLNGGPYGQLDQQATLTNSYGADLQATYAGDLFSFKNQLTAGASFDGAATTFTAASLAGGLTTTRNFVGPGIVIDQADGSIAPVRADITNANWGVFIADTLDLTDNLSANLSGRLNVASISLADRIGTALTGNHAYARFNPAAGLAYKIAPWLTAYAGYSEANRAPTPAELSCASAADPCSLANFFVADPALKQVVARTIEVGIRGSFTPFDTATLSYSAGLFHSELSDDIQFVNSPVLGRAFFQNVGSTQRQGIDAGARLTTPRWQASVGYAFTDATFRSGFIESAGNNPAADANGNVTVRPGNRLPGIPRHQLKIGFRFNATEAWTVGATATAASATVLFGDEANLTPHLPGYATVTLHTSYRVRDGIELFASVENATDRRYYAYGTFSPVGQVVLSQAPNATNPRSYNIAAPVSGFAGIKATF